MFPVSVTDVLVRVPLVVVSVGSTIGELDMLDEDAPAPAEFTALTLNVCVPAAKPVKTWLVVLPTDVHAPSLRDTSYRVIAAPPLLAGAVQLSVIWFAPGVTLRVWGAPGTVIFGGVVIVIGLLCHVPVTPLTLAIALI